MSQKQSKKKRAAAKPQAAPRKSIRQVLRPKGLDNLDKAAALKDLVAPVAKLGGTDSSTFTSVVAKTEDQRAIEACCASFQTVWNESDTFKGVVASMSYVRRMYTVLFRRLQELVVDEFQTTFGPLPPEFVDYAAGAAMASASKPFDEHSLMRGIAEVVLPTLADVVDKHSANDAEEHKATLAEANERRRSRPVPIGFKHTPTQEDTSLSRDRALVLYGWKNAVHWLLDQACTEVLKAEDEPFMTVRLLTSAPKPEDQHARLVRLAPKMWSGCANSDRDLDAMSVRHIAKMAGAPVDFLVCDNLGAAFTGSFIGRPDVANAGDAHRRMMKWCKGTGAALLAAIPQAGQTLPDFTGPEFEQLKTFADLRGVSVQDYGDTYRIVVGGHASVFDVYKDVLDSYGAPSLIVD